MNITIEELLKNTSEYNILENNIYKDDKIYFHRSMKYGYLIKDSVLYDIDDILSIEYIERFYKNNSKIYYFLKKYYFIYAKIFNIPHYDIQNYIMNCPDTENVKLINTDEDIPLLEILYNRYDYSEYYKWDSLNLNWTSFDNYNHDLFKYRNYLEFERFDEMFIGGGFEPNSEDGIIIMNDDIFCFEYKNKLYYYEKQYSGDSYDYEQSNDIGRMNRLRLEKINKLQKMLNKLSNY